MRYFIVRNVYSPLDFGGQHDSYHLVKAESWGYAVNLIWKHEIFDEGRRPVRNEIAWKGDEKKAREVFFSGTPVYYEKDGELMTEEL